MAEGVQSNVSIAPDNTGTGFHAIRTVTVKPNVDNSMPSTEKQQVVTLADGQGQLMGVVDGQGMTSDQVTHSLLRALVLRLDFLNAALDKTYSPPDELYKD